MIEYHSFGREIQKLNIAGLCKGSTTDSDSVCLGSNPSSATMQEQQQAMLLLFFRGVAQLVECCVRDAEAASSNLATPTKKTASPFGGAVFLFRGVRGRTPEIASLLFDLHPPSRDFRSKLSAAKLDCIEHSPLRPRKTIGFRRWFFLFGVSE